MANIPIRKTLHGNVLGLSDDEQVIVNPEAGGALQRVLAHYTGETGAWTLRDPDGAEVAAGAGGSGAGGGLGANDLTAITTEVDPINGGYRLATAQQSGVASAVTYNGSGDIAAVTIDLPTTDIVSTYNYTNDLPYISGNWYVGGGLRMSSAQASEFKTNLVAAGANAAGFRVFVHDLAQGVTLEWNATAQSYRGINGSPILLNDDRANGTNLLANTSETAAQKTVIIPGWLTSTHSEFEVEAHTTWSGTGRTTGTARVKFGGTTVAQTAAAAAQLTFVQRASVMNTANKSAQKFWPATASTAMALLGETTSGAFTTSAINTGNDTAVTITHQVDAYASDSAVVTFFRVAVTNP